MADQQQQQQAWMDKVQAQIAQLQQQNQQLATVLAQPTPMEINMVGSEQRPFTGRCFKCGEPGHKAVNCRRRQGQHGGFATPPTGAKQRPKN
jgi:hypothetical protein